MKVGVVIGDVAWDLSTYAKANRFAIPPSTARAAVQ